MKNKLRFINSPFLMKFRLLFLVCASVMMLYSNDAPADPPQYAMRGIDTIYVMGIQGAPSALSRSLPWPQKYEPTEKGVAFDAVSEAFSKYPWVKILSAIDRSVNRDEAKKPNVVTFWFMVSAQEERIANKKFRTASIGLQVFKLTEGKLPAFFGLKLNPVTYSFIVPETTTEFEAKIKEGIHFLIDHFPSAFPCPKEMRDGTNCPETNVIPYDQEPPAQ